MVHLSDELGAFTNDEIDELVDKYILFEDEDYEDYFEEELIIVRLLSTILKMREMGTV